MITVPARRVKQFGVGFYQAGLSAKDIDRLVKFEVLGYSGGPQEEAPKKSRSSARSRVNWDMLEKRIGESETAYQRPVIRRKIDELVMYYRECKDAGTLPAIPGAVIITSEKRFTFTPVAGHHDLGLLQIPEEHGVLRVLDGGGKIQEIRKGAKRFFLNYVKALSTTFPAAWAGRKYSIKTGAALRAFIRAAPDVMARARELRRDPFDLNAIREAIKPWGERLRDRRFGPLETTINSIGQERRLHPNLVDLSNVDPRRGRGLMGWDDRRMLYQSGNQLWHTDSSFKPVPALASLLSGREVPPVGGETEFTSMRDAYATLPEATTRTLEGKVTVHSILYSRSTIAPGLFDPEQEREQPPVRQALVRANPVNGQKSIYIGSHAWYVEGMDYDESRRLLDELLAH